MNKIFSFNKKQFTTIILVPTPNSLLNSHKLFSLQSCDLLDLFLSAGQVRSLLKKRKSFTGAELVQMIASTNHAQNISLDREGFFKPLIILVLLVI